MIAPLTVILMTKLPRPGSVKTRLQPDLTPQQAADIHHAMLVHVVERLAEFQPTELVICFDPPDAGSAMQALLPRINARFLPQSAGDLGARLATAKSALANPHSVLFLGVDSPDLPTDHLIQAVRLCREADVVLGRTRDGGYWCLGLGPSVPADRLLHRIDWSSGREADQTIAAAERIGLSAALADDWDDVDNIEDLNGLIERLGQSTDLRDIHLRCRLTSIIEVKQND